MKNKALFYGSSFTWGNGLWIFDFDGYHKKYFDDPNWDWRNLLLPRSDIYESDMDIPIPGLHSGFVNESAREFMYKNRWSTLVTDYYGMEEINRAEAGGFISETVMMMSGLESSSPEFYRDFQRYVNWEDIGLLSIEFYGVARLSGMTPTEIENFIDNSDDEHATEVLKNWVINFDYDFQIKTQLQKLEEQLEKISKFNIPTVIHFWQKDDIRKMRNLISDYPLIDKYTMNKDVAILDWANGRYKIHDEHPYYNKSIGKEDEHLGVRGHRKLSERIINYLGKI